MGIIGAHITKPNPSKYFSITYLNNDYVLHERSEMIIDEKVLYWLQIIDTGKRWGTNWTNGENQFEIFIYKVFDSNLKETKIKVGNWTVQEIYDPPSEKHSYSTTKFSMSDSRGYMERHKIYPSFVSPYNYSDENAILYLLKFLEEIKEFSDWHTVKLFYENRKLLQEIEQLKNEVNKLKAKLQ